MRVGYESAILRAVKLVNEQQKRKLVASIQGCYGSNPHGRAFALRGLAFKANTGGMREAPSRALLEGLWQAGALVRTFDSEAMPECRRLYGERDDLTRPWPAPTRWEW